MTNALLPTKPGRRGIRPFAGKFRAILFHTMTEFFVTRCLVGRSRGDLLQRGFQGRRMDMAGIGTRAETRSIRYTQNGESPLRIFDSWRSISVITGTPQVSGKPP